MTGFEALFRPLSIRGMTLRNRFVSTSHNPHYEEDGMPGERYQRYELEKARGGCALLMFAGQGAVSRDANISGRQLQLHRPEIIAPLRRFSERAHREGAALMAQLTHTGRKSAWDRADWLVAAGPSALGERFNRRFPKELERFEIERIVEAYARAAHHCAEGGLDGVELMAHTHHLIDQFWSPAINRRRDRYGGSLGNRMRFGLEVLEAVRARVGQDFVIGLRMSAHEMLEGGNSRQDSLHIAETYARNGVDLLSVTAGSLATTRLKSEFSMGMWAPQAPNLELARAVKERVDVPVLHAGRLYDFEKAARAIEEGAIDLAGMTRPQIADPHLVNKLKEGREDDIRPCVGANYCLDREATGGDMVCLHSAATGREQSLPHVISRTQHCSRIVVVGGGPAGLESARVCAERGHQVVLFEREAELGGQLNIAARAAWRGEMIRVRSWLEHQVRKLHVQLRLDETADRERILALEPDVVIIATGGRPSKGEFEGEALACTTWEILEGTVRPGQRVLVHDDHGAAQALSCAQHLADLGAMVELVTPDTSIGSALGPNNYGIFKRGLYERGARLTVDHELIRVGRWGNELVAELRNVYTETSEERRVDTVVSEHGTIAEDGLYLDLKQDSANAGALDLDALAEGRAQPGHAATSAGFRLYRIGDALSGRDVAAAVYDALRLCNAL